MRRYKLLLATLCFAFLVKGVKAQEDATDEGIRFRHVIGTHLLQFSLQGNYEFRWSKRHSSLISAIWKWESYSLDGYLLVFDRYPGELTKGFQLDLRHRVLLTQPDPDRFQGFLVSGLVGITRGSALQYIPIRWEYDRMHVGLEAGYRWELGAKRRMLFAMYGGFVYRIPFLNTPDWFTQRPFSGPPFHGVSNQMQGLLFTSGLELGIPLGRKRTSSLSN